MANDILASRRASEEWMKLGRRPLRDGGLQFFCVFQGLVRQCFDTEFCVGRRPSEINVEEAFRTRPMLLARLAQAVPLDGSHKCLQNMLRAVQKGRAEQQGLDDGSEQLHATAPDVDAIDWRWAIRFLEECSDSRSAAVSAGWPGCLAASAFHRASHLC